DAPLYPVHHLLFDQGQPSPAESVRLHLTNARRALDRAAATIGPARAAALDDARRNLTEARKLIPRITDAPVRHQLGTELDDLDQRVDQLANLDQPNSTTDSNNQNNQNNQNDQNNQTGESGQHGGAGTSGPQNDPSGGDHGGAGQTGSVPTDNRH